MHGFEKMVSSKRMVRDRFEHQTLIHGAINAVLGDVLGGSGGGLDAR